MDCTYVTNRLSLDLRFSVCQLLLVGCFHFPLCKSSSYYLIQYEQLIRFVLVYFFGVLDFLRVY
jgi:hypothetical protein